MSRTEAVYGGAVLVGTTLFAYFVNRWLDAALLDKGIFHDAALFIVMLAAICVGGLVLLRLVRPIVPAPSVLATSTRPLDTHEGRKKFVDGLVVFHGQGVKLQTQGNYLWSDDQEMIDWMAKRANCSAKFLDGCARSTALTTKSTTLEYSRRRASAGSPPLRRLGSR